MNPVRSGRKSIVNYKKGDLIGQGANGKVYLSFDADNCQFIAVKEVTFANVPPNILEEVSISG
jgi:serine/threonine protein kinase